MSFLAAGQMSDLRGMISLREVLREMHAGGAFSLKYIAYDKRRRDKCGRVLSIEEGQLLWASLPKHFQGIRPMTELERQLSGSSVATKGCRINPRHGDNFTRNIRQLVNGQPTEDIRKLHILLIVEFNGQPTTA
jgi:hypothetical protein